MIIWSPGATDEMVDGGPSARQNRRHQSLRAGGRARDSGVYGRGTTGTMKRIAVIGGGASGLIAAWHCAQKKNRVTLFEKQKTLGRKLLATGNGRCNVSNRHIDVARYHGGNPRFVQNIFPRFGLQETREFFLSIGIPFVELEKGRLYPASLQAVSIQRAFEYELARKGVDVRLHRKIESIEPGEGGIKVVTGGREETVFDSVIIAAGSCAWPPLGGSRAGYELAGSLGHTVREPFPAIVPLNIPLKALHRLEGVKWDCEVTVGVNGKARASAREELLFTSYGISGPAALEVSRAVNGALRSGSAPEIRVDLFPHLGPDELDSMLRDIWQDGEKGVAFSMSGIIKDRIPRVLLPLAGIDPETPVKLLGADRRRAVISLLKSLSIQPGDPRSFSEAVVAAGGVNVDEVNPATMESRKVRNIHITGELLDIDGDSGGYNLQFAWSTGAIAGMAQR